MLGLMYTTVAPASLFPNLEGIFTAVLAWVVFKENTDHKIVGGMLCIVAGGLQLSCTEQDGSFRVGSMLGSLYILAACLCWSIDNSLMRKVFVSDTLYCWIQGHSFGSGQHRMGTTVGMYNSYLAR